MISRHTFLESYFSSKRDIQRDHLFQRLQHRQTQSLMLPARLQHVLCVCNQPYINHTSALYKCQPRPIKNFMRMQNNFWGVGMPRGPSE